MLVDFVTCGDCECQECNRKISCPKTDMLDDPCIECQGTPPYAPWEANEKTLCNYSCNEKLSRFKRTD